MESLFELGKRHETDKVPHAYLPHYAGKFESKRQDPVTLLEIGIMRGASLQMWGDYFPQGQIYGIDIEPDTMVRKDRIKCFCGSQSDNVFLNKVVRETGSLNFVVDDGSHKGTDHVASFHVLWPHVVPGGWYCIEDATSIFNTCWTQPGQRTILNIVQEQWSEILRSRGNIAEVTVVGCDTRMPKNGRNNGLVLLQKAVDSGETEGERVDNDQLFSSYKEYN